VTRTRFAFPLVKSMLAAALIVLGISAIAQATNISNGGFESGTAVTNPNNATPWQWTPSSNGERVNALTNSGADNGSGALGTHLIDPAFGSWFGYVENSSTNASADVEQTVVVDPSTPTLNFWWQFFTNETPNQDNTFNDRFQVDIEGNTSSITTIASVNATPMITTNGPLYTPTGGPPGLDQAFNYYTAGWTNTSLNASAFAGQTVTVYFRVSDVGGPHSQSSGFALDNVQFVVPEPSSIALLAFGSLFLGIPILRRRRARTNA